MILKSDELTAGPDRVPVLRRARLEVGPFRVPIVIVAAFALAWALWVEPLGWFTAALVYVALVGAALAVIDARTHRLPNALVWPSYPIVAVLLILAAWGTGDWGALGRAGLGAAVMLAWYFALFWFNPSGIGLGDVKLAGILGAVLGWVSWTAVAIGLFAGFALGAVAGLGLIMARRATRRTAIAFGPFMLAGAVVGVTVANWR